jgi:hypothetical protein
MAVVLVLLTSRSDRAERNLAIHNTNSEEKTGPWLKPFLLARDSSAAPEGAAPPTEDRGLPPFVGAEAPAPKVPTKKEGASLG